MKLKYWGGTRAPILRIWVALRERSWAWLGREGGLARGPHPRPQVRHTRPRIGLFFAWLSCQNPTQRRRRMREREREREERGVDGFEDRERGVPSLPCTWGRETREREIQTINVKSWQKFSLSVGHVRCTWPCTRVFLLVWHLSLYAVAAAALCGGNPCPLVITG